MLVGFENERKYVADDDTIMAHLANIQNMNPTWGSTRIWSYMRYSRDLNVTRGSVARMVALLKQRQQTQTKVSSYKARQRAKQPQPPLWQMDMFTYKADGWADLKIIYAMEAATGLVKGFTFTASCRAWHWLLALNQALENHEPGEKTVCLVTDKKSQPASVTFMRACWDLGIEHHITDDVLPGETFSLFLRRWIEEKLPGYWVQKTFCEALDQCVRDFNKRRVMEMRTAQESSTRGMLDGKSAKIGPKC